MHAPVVSFAEYLFEKDVSPAPRRTTPLRGRAPRRLNSGGGATQDRWSGKARKQFRQLAGQHAKPTFPYERGRGTAAPAGLKAAVEEVVEIEENLFEKDVSPAPRRTTPQGGVGSSALK